MPCARCLLELPAKTLISEVKSHIGNEYFAILSSDAQALNDSDYAGTQMLIQVLDKNSQVLSEYSVIVLYDIDGNGLIQADDARLALRTAVSLESLNSIERTAADVDADNSVTADDARRILRKAVGLD